jgi:protein involved in temperature-dependent protein secretion
VGQRILATDQDEYPLLDIRRIDLHSADAIPAATESNDG